MSAFPIDGQFAAAAHRLILRHATGPAQALPAHAVASSLPATAGDAALNDLRHRLFGEGDAAARDEWLRGLQARMQRGDIEAADAEFDRVLGLPTYRHGGEGGYFSEIGAVSVSLPHLSAPQPSSLWYLLAVAAALRIDADDVLLDLGSGIGKAVLFFAAFTPVLHAIGVEIIPAYPDFARRLAEERGLAGRTDFVASDVRDADFSGANVFYAYNFGDPVKGRAVYDAVAERLIAEGRERPIKIAAKGILWRYLAAADDVFVECPVAGTRDLWTVFASRGSALADAITAQETARRSVQAPPRHAPHTDPLARSDWAEVRRWCSPLGLSAAEVAAEYRAHDWAGAIERHAGLRPAAALGVREFVRACAYAALAPVLERREAEALQALRRSTDGRSAYEVMAARERARAELAATQAVRASAGLSAIVPEESPRDILAAVFGSQDSRRARSRERPASAISLPAFLRVCLHTLIGPRTDGVRERLEIELEDAMMRADAFDRIEEADDPRRLWQGGAPVDWPVAVFGDTAIARRLQDRIGQLWLPAMRMPPLYLWPAEGQAAYYGIRALVGVDGLGTPVSQRFAALAGYAGRWMPLGNAREEAPIWGGGYADAFGPSFTHWAQELAADHRVLLTGPGAEALARSWSEPSPLDRQLGGPISPPQVVIGSPPGSGARQTGGFHGIVHHAAHGDEPALQALVFDAGLSLHPGGRLFFDFDPGATPLRSEDGDPLTLEAMFAHYVTGLRLMPVRMHPDALIFGQWQYGARVAKMAERTDEPLRVPRLEPGIDPATGARCLVVSPDRGTMASRRRIVL